MHCIKRSLLKHMGLLRPVSLHGASKTSIGVMKFTSGNGGDQDQILTRVIELVSKYDQTNASKVTEKSDFQKDLSLDSLDRVEIVMAIEEEFKIEIPEEKADKLTCCGDIASYIISETRSKTSDS